MTATLVVEVRVRQCMGSDYVLLERGKQSAPSKAATGIDQHVTGQIDVGRLYQRETPEIRCNLLHGHFLLSPAT